MQPPWSPWEYFTRGTISIWKVLSSSLTLTQSSISKLSTEVKMMWEWPVGAKSVIGDYVLKNVPPHKPRRSKMGEWTGWTMDRALLVRVRPRPWPSGRVLCVLTGSGHEVFPLFLPFPPHSEGGVSQTGLQPVTTFGSMSSNLLKYFLPSVHVWNFHLHVSSLLEQKNIC